MVLRNEKSKEKINTIEIEFLKSVNSLVNIEKYQFRFRPGMGITDAFSALKKIQMGFRDESKNFKKTSKKVFKNFFRIDDTEERCLEVLVKALMSMYEGTKT